MSVHLDELYFDWLYGLVCSIKTRNPLRSYRNILHILYTKEFVWLIPNDDNRIEDGKDLRYEFMSRQGMDIGYSDPIWMNLPCSMLELLIALSFRLEFQTDIPVSDNFWELMDNLGLSEYNDRADIPLDEVDDILDTVIWRTYEPNGMGGLFPLNNPYEDQREVEIWYQLSAYIIERSDALVEGG